jgi:AraC family transcriptional regulator
MRSVISAGTLGARHHQLAASGFRFTETSHPAGHRLPRHSHECMNLVFVFEGGFTETCTKGSFECGPQSILLKPAGEPHSDVYGERGVRCLVLEVSEHRRPLIDGTSRTVSRVDLLQGGELYRLALRTRPELRSPDSASPLTLEGIALEMMGEALRACLPAKANKPAWLDRVVEYLEVHFSRTFSLEEVAHEAGIHPFHLARSFRQHLRCTVGERVRQLRVEFACRQLANNESPLVQIALRAGFSHQAHFCRVFKQQTGMTPSDFRRLYSGASQG